MDLDEDDDFYAPEDTVQPGTEETPKTETAIVKQDPDDEDLEEGEEEGEAGSEGSDSVRSTMQMYMVGL
jgi:pre-mRNA 3'-end-processing factor FIP1